MILISHPNKVNGIIIYSLTPVNSKGRIFFHFYLNFFLFFLASLYFSYYNSVTSFQEREKTAVDNLLITKIAMLEIFITC